MNTLTDYKSKFSSRWSVFSNEFVKIGFKLEEKNEKYMFGIF